MHASTLHKANFYPCFIFFYFFSMHPSPPSDRAKHRQTVEVEVVTLGPKWRKGICIWIPSSLRTNCCMVSHGDDGVMAWAWCAT